MRGAVSSTWGLEHSSMRPILTGGNGFAKGTLHTSLRATKAGVVLLTAVLAGLSSGCVYRMGIVQGNFMEGKTIDQLQVGMTRAQVRYLLGTPMVPDSFNKERWDYLLYFKQGHIKTPQEWHLIVYFQEDKVSKFDRTDATDEQLSSLAPSEAKQQKKTAPVARFPKMGGG